MLPFDCCKFSTKKVQGMQHEYTDKMVTPWGWDEGNERSEYSTAYVPPYRR